MKTTAKAALTKALPQLKGDGSKYLRERKAHMTSLVSSDFLDTHGGGFPLEVDDKLEGDALAEAVFSAFPSLGHTETPNR